MATRTGTIAKVSGPTVVAQGVAGACLYEVVYVGKDGLLGEIIRLEADTAFIQVYEDTAGLSVNDPIECSGAPLSVELGPGIMSLVFDGIQRPLAKLEEATGPFIGKGLTVAAVDRERKWDFTPAVAKGDTIEGGTILGTTQETASMLHKILTPNHVSGVIKEARTGQLTAAETVVVLEDGTELNMIQKWPVKTPRPVKKKLDPTTLFITGQRVLDTLFPVALGGTVILPGGFGTGKTVLEQSLAKFSCADCVVYVGCGERGNEMTDMLTEFPALSDPRTGGALMDRCILLANTSNMPVAAREASIYTGVTIAEYYRDMGYDVALMADSTSRWAEALREISSRLEELPGEEGYPTYLATRLAKFYERAGRAELMGKDAQGSVTIAGAVSPPGGDFSEPVTQSSMRVAGAVWSLDSTLAYRRHYPSINWIRSYSSYDLLLEKWFAENAPVGWATCKNQIVKILAEDARLQEIVQLIGPDALQNNDRLLLEVSRMIREIFLQQNSFDPNDAFCTIEKQYGLMNAILEFYNAGSRALKEGASIADLTALDARVAISRLRTVPDDEFQDEHRACVDKLLASVDAVERDRSSERPTKNDSSGDDQ